MLAVPAIVTIAIDLIGMDRFRVVAKAVAIGFYLVDKLTTFIEVVPADCVNKANAVNEADTDLAPNSVSAAAFPRLMGRT